MSQGWLKEILDENRRKVENWPDWKKPQQINNLNDKKDEVKASGQMTNSYK